MIFLYILAAIIAAFFLTALLVKKDFSLEKQILINKSQKEVFDYLKLIRHLDIKPDEFLMIGNSLKSDCMPVLAIGGHAVHVPYHTTWVHEQIDHTLAHPNFREAEHIKDILPSLLS